MVQTQSGASPSSPTTTTLAPASASTGTPSPRERRSSRKARHHHGINIPADSLLRFSTYHPPSPAEQSHSSSSTHSSSYYSHHKALQSALRARPREHFVQANFRFLVAQPTSDTFADLRTCQLIPEALVPWSSVDRVILPRPSDCCPICLFPLRCPRVSPCGHVFDHVCMLQLFSHASPLKFVRCPLCFHSVSDTSLRPCAFATAVAPAVGEAMPMQLVTRKRGSMICHAYCTSSTNDDEIINANIDIDDLNQIPIIKAVDNPLFSRIAYTDPNFLLQLIERDGQDLKQMLSEDPSLAPFVAKAMEDLELRRGDIYQRRDVSGGGGPAESSTDSPSSSCQLNGRINSEPGHVRHRQSRQPSTLQHELGVQRPSKGPWYFYQDAGSGNTFLHPVNHRCLSTELKNEFGKACTIEGKIVEIERHVMVETLRRRYRFLEHLPDGCEFAFVELDLNDMLSDDTMSAHEHELKERKQTRKKREIAYAKETERVEREQTDSLRKYYTSLGRPGSSAGDENLNTNFEFLMNNLSQLSVDRTDETNFPKLSEVEEHTDDAVPSSSSNVPTTSGYPIATDGSGAGTYSSSGWGPSASSYSSVTSNMGLFPALSSSPQTETPVLRGAWGSSTPSTPPLGSSPQPSLGVWGNNGTTSSQPTASGSSASGSTTVGVGNRRGEKMEAGTSSRGIEVPNSGWASNRTGAQQPSETRRNGRRSTGKSTLLLSNAGAQARR